MPKKVEELTRFLVTQHQPLQSPSTDDTNQRIVPRKYTACKWLAENWPAQSLAEINKQRAPCGICKKWAEIWVRVFIKIEWCDV